MSDWRNLLYAGFALFLAAMAFVSPVPNDFDRYIYEALVGGRHSTVQEIYPTLKHETPRAEASTVLDSPEHLGQLEPLYAIRPLYIETISTLSRWLTIQRSINAVSAASLFGIALVLAIWTRKQLYCAMFLSWPTI